MIVEGFLNEVIETINNTDIKTFILKLFRESIKKVNL